MDSTVGTGYADLRAQLLGRTGVPGPARRRALARLTDSWLGELAQEAGVNVGGVALVAVGGYGRGELSPFSDLDLVLLHSSETPTSYAEMLAERLWYPIWDSKVKLDHSVRSVGGARQIARVDLPAMLGMLDLRHIAGDPELAGLLRRRVLADWRADAKERLPLLEASCAERTERSGELAFATEPNLKESRGGLRDLVVMRAVAASWLADCPHQGLEEARSDLLDVRDALHLTAGRRTDRLHIQDQDEVAKALDIPDRDSLLVTVAGIGRDGRAGRRPHLAPGAPGHRRAQPQRPGLRRRRPVRPPRPAAAAGRRRRRAGGRGHPGPGRQPGPRPGAAGPGRRRRRAGRADHRPGHRAPAGQALPAAARPRGRRPR